MPIAENPCDSTGQDASVQKPDFLVEPPVSATHSKSVLSIALVGMLSSLLACRSDEDTVAAIEEPSYPPSCVPIGIQDPSLQVLFDNAIKPQGEQSIFPENNDPYVQKVRRCLILFFTSYGTLL